MRVSSGTSVSGKTQFDVLVKESNLLSNGTKNAMALLFWLLLSAQSIAQSLTPFDYYRREFIDDLLAKKKQLVLVATGWSQSGLEKMFRVRNIEKQKRAFAPHYALALNLYREGGRVKLYYLTTTNIHVSYRQYLYTMATGDTDVRGFRRFERQCVKIIHLEAPPRHEHAQMEDRLAYMESVANKRKLQRLHDDLDRYRQVPGTVLGGFTVHATGNFMQQRAKWLDIPYLAGDSAHTFWKRKSSSRMSYVGAKIPHPRGTYRPACTVDTLASDIYGVLADTGSSKIIVKLEFSAGGDGNRVIDFSKELSRPEFLAERDQAIAAIRERFEFSENYLRRLTTNGAIVEEFLVGSDFSSPATLYMLTDVDQVNVYYGYQQILGGDDHQVFQGSLGPLSAGKVADTIASYSKRIGTFMADHGVKGHVGTDFVVLTPPGTTQKKIYAIENNVRNTGTMYPIWTLGFMLGHERLQQRHVMSFDDAPIVRYRRSGYRNTLQRHFFAWIARQPYSFNRESGAGLLVHLPRFGMGRVGVAIVGRDKQECQDTMKRFRADLARFNEQIMGIL